MSMLHWFEHAIYSCTTAVPRRCQQVLKLKKASFGTPGLPAGLVACSRLAVLAIDGAAVGAVSLADPARRRPMQPLKELPEGPYLLRLTRSVCRPWS